MDATVGHGRADRADDRVAERIGERRGHGGELVTASEDENQELFRFLLFVQHGQLGKLEPDIPTPVSAVRAVMSRAIASGDIPAQSPDLATAVLFGVVLEPVQFAAYGRLPPEMSSMCDRLTAAAWAAVTTV